MGISGIPGSNAQVYRQQFQQFRQGKVNIQKSDLEGLKTSLGTAGSSAATGLDELLSSFDQIDKNQDGISFQELLAFTRAQGGAPASSAGGAQGNCATCSQCGQCGKAASGQESGGIEGGGPPGGRGHHKMGRDLPPVSIEDLNDYKSFLEGQGKAVPPELEELIAGFSGIDGDQSGTISVAELNIFIEATRPKPSAEPMSLSKDDLVALKDRITLASQESTAGIDTLISGFAQADTNGDGQIDFGELQRFLSMGRPQAESASEQSVPSARTPGILAATERTTAEQSSERAPATPFSPRLLLKLVQEYGQKIQMQHGGTFQIEV